MDILIKNATLREKQYPVNIGISAGIITHIYPSKSDLNTEMEASAVNVIDAAENLVTPTFIEPHLHIDTAFISEKMHFNKTGILAETAEASWNAEKDYTTEDVMSRAQRVLEMGILNGVTKYRTHINVNTITGLQGLEAIVNLRKQFKDIVSIQIAAFPGQGIYKDRGCNKLMKKAMKKGADVVGGIPYSEMTYDETKKHIDFCFKLAKDHNAYIDIHIDEITDPSARSLEYLASKTIREKFHGKVTAGHVCALASYDENYANKVIALVKEAGINIITTPTADLMLQNKQDNQPLKRRITRIRELLNKGITVAYGQDYIKDLNYPTWGRLDPLEIGMITAHAAQLSQPYEIETLFNMPTYNSAKILGLSNYRISEGSNADINILAAKTVQEAFRNLTDRLYVISSGNLIATTSNIRTLNL